jgi:hypothetical protein
LPNIRNLRLDKYGISKHRYNELKNFCLQYGEWKDELKYKTDAVKSPQITGMPFVGGISDSTCNLASRRAELSKKCEIIEQTMILAITTLKKGNTSKLLYDGDYKDLYDHMIKAVTEEGITYNYLFQRMNIPIGRDSFYMMRRYFFYLLDKFKSPYV